MKKIVQTIIVFTATLYFVSCGGTKDKTAVDIPDITDVEEEAFKQTEGDTIKIANEELEYEIIIIEPGFYYWLQSIARPRGFYGQPFLENRNILMVNEWNQRVLQPNRFSPNLYELQINYQQGIDYGYEVNYQLYNYFIYFQRKYRQRLGPFIPRI